MDSLAEFDALLAAIVLQPREEDKPCSSCCSGRSPAGSPTDSQPEFEGGPGDG